MPSAVLLSALAAALPTLGPLSVEPPNVLIVVADDLGVDQLGFYGVGQDPPETPVLDGLAQGGVTFARAWGNPVCTPSRAALLTGRHGFRTGIGSLNKNAGHALSLDETTIAEAVESALPGVYDFAAFGKWPGLKNESGGGIDAPNLSGWDHFAGIHTLFAYDAWIKVVDGVESASTTYATTEQVDDVLAWIASRDGPWIAHLAFNAPHKPFHAPPSHLHTVDLGGAGPPEEDPRPYFRAMVEALDTELGRLLAFLDVGGELDDTVVLFLGDNGTTPEVVVPPLDPEHAKATAYQGGVRVPLVVAGPPVAVPGATCGALVGVTDVLATVVELAGAELAGAVPPGTELDSISLVPYLADPTAPSQRAALYTEGFAPNGLGAPLVHLQAVRGERYKAILRTAAPDELYDLASDPLETLELVAAGLAPEEEAALTDLKAAAAALVGPPSASVHDYGCLWPKAPEVSLAIDDPTPAPGQVVTFSIDNPFGTQLPGALPVLFGSLSPAPGFPCGVVAPGFGLAGGGAPGEWLVELDGSLGAPLVGPLWAGPGTPSELTVTLPAGPYPLPRLYFQAVLNDPSGLGEVEVAYTRALAVQAD